MEEIFTKVIISAAFAVIMSGLWVALSMLARTLVTILSKGRITYSSKKQIRELAWIICVIAFILCLGGLTIG